MAQIIEFTAYFDKCLQVVRVARLGYEISL